MKPIIVISSGGKNWVGKICPPEGKMHGIKIVQMFMDAEEAMPIDPVDSLPNLPAVGHREIVEAIMKDDGVYQWFRDKCGEVFDKIKKLDQSGEKYILHISFRCKGGFQRSPAMAIAMDDFLKKRDIYPILHHMTSDIAMAVKAIIKK